MAFNIGRKPPNAVQRALLPAAHGMDKIANQRISNTVSRFNEKYTTALKVDGAPLRVWIRSNKGEFCTCSAHSRELMSPQTIGSDRIDDLGVLDVPKPEKTDNGLFSIITLRGDPEPTTRDPKNFRLLDKKTEPDFAEEERELKEITDIIEQDVDISGNNLTDELRWVPDERVRQLFSGDKTQCGICFTSGYVDGYSLFGGKRFVLDSTSEYTQYGFELITETAPYSFSSGYNESHYIEWVVPLPKYFVTCNSVHVRNNMKKSAGIKAMVSADSRATWTELTPEFIRSRSGIDTVLIIRAIPSDNFASATFTHIEFSLEYIPPVLGQVQPYSEGINVEFYEALSTTTIELPPSIPNLTRESVIYDGKHNVMWKIIDITRHKTAQDLLFSYDISVRRIQMAEQLALLSLALGSDIDINFRGVEQIQGIKNIGEIDD